MNNKKIFVLDTNILLHEPTAFLSFEEHDVTLPMTVIEELDRIKDRKSDKSRDARQAIKAIEQIFADATPEEIHAGVQMVGQNGVERGCLSIFNDMMVDNREKEEPKITEVGGFYSSKGEADPDFFIMRAAMYLQMQYEGQRQVVLVTKDMNMRLRSKSMGIKFIEDFRSDRVVEDVKFLAKGYEKFGSDFWKKISDENYQVETFSRDGKTVHEVSGEFFESPYINQYLIDETKKFTGKVVEVEDNKVVFEEKGYNSLMRIDAWGISPKNIQQAMALDALLDQDIDLVTLTGAAGSGKTLLALAASLTQVIDLKRYNKIIVTRNTPLIAEDIGFLPGSETEKLAPWLAAISDTLEVLHKDDANPAGSIEYIKEKANIQYKSVNFMRGRSIQDAIVILDESQNLTPSQMKTIITRCGQNTKLICLGNLAQIDSNYLSAITSGLTYVVEKFKYYEGSTTVNLNGVMRSRLASFAEENL